MFALAIPDSFVTTPTVIVCLLKGKQYVVTKRMIFIFLMWLHSSILILTCYKGCKVFQPNNKKGNVATVGREQKSFGYILCLIKVQPHKCSHISKVQPHRFCTNWQPWRAEAKTAFKAIPQTTPDLKMAVFRQERAELQHQEGS